MSDNEKELLNLINAHDNPDKAFEIAFNLLIEFLDGREEPQDTYSARLQVTA